MSLLNGIRLNGTEYQFPRMDFLWSVIAGGAHIVNNSFTYRNHLDNVTSYGSIVDTKSLVFTTTGLASLSVPSQPRPLDYVPFKGIPPSFVLAPKAKSIVFNIVLYLTQASWVTYYAIKGVKIVMIPSVADLASDAFSYSDSDFEVWMCLPDRSEGLTMAEVRAIPTTAGRNDTSLSVRTRRRQGHPLH